MGFFGSGSPKMPTRDAALPGRATQMPVAARHAVLNGAMRAPWPQGSDIAWFGMGCYWGAERKFWQTHGVLSTAVGFAGGFTVNPTYRETCTGQTGHTEIVQVVFDPAQVSFLELLRLFWENHDPTQGFRQGGDVGTQYRSAIYCATDAQLQAALASRDAYQVALSAAGLGPITTEIALAGPFYYAEDEHQQYLHKNPHGYCGLGGTGVTCQIGTGVKRG
jgi:peptide-methionine (S)-S-oxide reductase